MQLINEYIYFGSSSIESVAETSCLISKDAEFTHLEYRIAPSDCFFEFSANNIQIRIANAYFEKYQEPFEILIAKQGVCCNTQSKLLELLTCTLQGLAKKIFQESIVLHLIHQVQKNNLLFQLNCDVCSFVNKPIELEKVQKAKEYITAHIAENITIPLIASVVGTNQCYLKKSFKEVVGQTIFEYLQESRMNMAKHILSNSDSTVADVAEQVGYASASSFSTTFKNFFGYSPAKVNRV